jgi:putative transposase
MPRPPRIIFAGAYYHVYNRGVEKRSICFDDQDRKIFTHFLAQAVAKFNLNLFSYCLMDNHFHLFLQTTLPNLDSAMQDFQGQYAHQINLSHHRVGSLFQGRYKDRLVDTDQYALALTRYIHKNPLEAGLIKKPENYRWSSYPCYIGKLPKWKWLNTSWVLQQFHKNPREAKNLFEKFHQQNPTIFELEKLSNIRCSLGSPKETPRRGSDPLKGV